MEKAWPARMEVLQRRPFLILDCAHNVASVEALVETLDSSFPLTRRWLIFAASNDKDVPGMFRVLAPQFAHVFLTRYGGSLRSLPPEELASRLREVSDVPFTVHASPAEAWRAARKAPWSFSISSPSPPPRYGCPSALFIPPPC